jgi:hypothetical protein
VKEKGVISCAMKVLVGNSTEIQPFRPDVASHLSGGPFSIELQFGLDRKQRFHNIPCKLVGAKEFLAAVSFHQMKHVVSAAQEQE